MKIRVMLKEALLWIRDELAREMMLEACIMGL
jgi:hypothetical protein